ncbi:MAG: bifunctional DNA-formamidopyrimidine glycosylase/DNA-(apurinic or apyrimidinic site) lyase [Acidobacteria bacterium]|jgi:formamidopyrimidine-DNA glycosylase|nr:bifunctional DNA-formamidopyrimidine glycosylase/DNA-(apurinic or apyrimidinic site) lyase [Acidobacteriota bacterium]
MPELPEVETIVRQLCRQIKGKTITSVRLLWPRTVTGCKAEFCRRLRGMTVAGVSRRGKYIGVEGVDGTFFTVHLRMTGKLVGEISSADRKHLRTQFTFSDGTALYFVDARKFGRLRLWTCRGQACPSLGPEPLRPAVVLTSLRRLKTRRPIKSVLLDQTVLAGIGNIYADEALFQAGMHPLTPAASLGEAQQQRLASVIPKVLRQAILRRGTTLRNYRTVADESGENQEHLNVYGRAGESCFQCGASIEKILINGRSSHYCPSCQKKMSDVRR